MAAGNSVRPGLRLLLASILSIFLLSAPLIFLLVVPVFADDLDALRSSILIEQQKETLLWIKLAFGALCTASIGAVSFLTKELLAAKKEFLEYLRQEKENHK